MPVKKKGRVCALHRSPTTGLELRRRGGWRSTGQAARQQRGTWWQPAATIWKLEALPSPSAAMPKLVLFVLCATAIVSLLGSKTSGGDAVVWVGFEQNLPAPSRQVRQIDRRTCQGAHGPDGELRTTVASCTW